MQSYNSRLLEMEALENQLLKQIKWIDSQQPNRLKTQPDSRKRTFDRSYTPINDANLDNSKSNKKYSQRSHSQLQKQKRKDRSVTTTACAKVSTAPKTKAVVPENPFRASASANKIRANCNSQAKQTTPAKDTKPKPVYASGSSHASLQRKVVGSVIVPSQSTTHKSIKNQPVIVENKSEERDNLFSDDEDKYQDYSFEEMLIQESQDDQIYYSPQTSEHSAAMLVQQSDPSSEYSSGSYKQVFPTRPTFAIPFRKTDETQQLNKMECTFQPSILEKSKKLANRLGPSFQRLTAPKQKVFLNTSSNGYRQRPKQTKIYSRERLSELSQPKQIDPSLLQDQVEIQIKETQQCTFRPSLSKKSAEMFQGNYLDVVSRNQLWEEQRQLKLLRLKEQEELEKAYKERQSSSILDKSDFKKALSKQVELSRFAKEGLVGYFQRVQTAQDLKKREEEAFTKFSGQKWKKQATQTKEFNLSKSRNKENKNIQNSYNPTNLDFGYSSGKQTGYKKQYNQAVQELHKKILELDI